MNTPDPTAPDLTDGEYVTTTGTRVRVERRTDGSARVHYPRHLTVDWSAAQWRKYTAGWEQVPA